MTPKEVLIKARSLIADESRWITGTLASTGLSPLESLPVAPNDPLASCWCALGAISAAVDFASYPSEDGPEAQEAVRLLARAIAEHYADELQPLVGSLDAAVKRAPEAVVYRLNDRVAGGHACVLGAYDAAIASCDD